MSRRKQLFPRPIKDCDKDIDREPSTKDTVTEKSKSPSLQHNFYQVDDNGNVNVNGNVSVNVNDNGNVSDYNINSPVHSEKCQSYNCKFCGRYFKHKRSRDRHIKLHTGDKRYKCAFCQTAFARSDHLTIHLKTHGKQRPYLCSKCKKRYSTQEDLITHVQLHNKKEAEILEKMECVEKENLKNFEYSEQPKLVNSQKAVKNCEMNLNNNKSEIVISAKENESKDSFYLNSNKYTFLKDEVERQKTETTKIEDKNDSKPCLENLENSLKITNGESEDREENITINDIEMDSENLAKESSSDALKIVDKNINEQLTEISTEFKKIVSHVSQSNNPQSSNTIESEKCSKIRIANLCDLENLKKEGTSSTNNLLINETIESKTDEIKTPHHTKDDDSQSTEHFNSINPTNYKTKSSMSFSPNYAHSTSKFKIVCPLCDSENFTTLEQFQLHVQSVHDSVKKEMGSDQTGLNDDTASKFFDISQKFYSNALENSIRNYSNTGITLNMFDAPTPREISCELCGTQVSGIPDLQRHVLTSHSFTDLLARAAEGVFCAQCLLPFSNPGALTEHIKLVHAPPLGSALSLLTSVLGTKRLSNPMELKTNLSQENRHQTFLNPQISSAFDSKLSDSVAASSKTESQFSNIFKAPGSQLPVVNLKPLKFSFENNGLADSKPLIEELHSILLCNQCDASFSNFESFRTHLKFHLDGSDSALFLCPECKTTVKSAESFETHVASHYESSWVEYSCSSCFKIFNKPDLLQKHLVDMHAHHLFKCSLCDELFDSKVSIQVHFAVSHSNEKKAFKCLKCSVNLDSKSDFILHLREKHIEIHLQNDQNVRQTKNIPSQISPKSAFRCLLCPTTLSNESEMNAHIATHEKRYQCPVCKDAFHVEFLLDRHLELSHAKELNGSNMSSQESVSQNVDSKDNVRNELNHRCVFCDIHFSTESNLLLHRKHVHGYDSLNDPGGSAICLFCPYCNETYNSKINLDTHIKHAHMISNGKHKCNICDKIFITTSDLTHHKLSHVKFLSNTTCCIVCKEELHSTQKFMEHQINHNIGQFPQVCMACKQSLSNETEVSIHAKFHTETHDDTEIKAPSIKHCNSAMEKNYTTETSNKTDQKFEFIKTSDGESNSAVKCSICQAKFECVDEFKSHFCFLIDRSPKSVSPYKYTTAANTFLTKPSFATDAYKNVKNIIKQENDTEPSNLNKNSADDKLEEFIETNQQRTYRKQQKYEQDELKFPSEPAKSSQEIKTYQCIKCQKDFDNEEDIKNHVATHLQEEGPGHQCYLCNTLLNSPLKLQCHLIEHTFEGFNSYNCYLCSAVFTTSGNLQKHMFNHGLKAKPYDCQLCNQSFYFRSELDNHMYSHNTPFNDSGNEKLIVSSGNVFPGTVSSSQTDSLNQMSSSYTQHHSIIPKKEFLYEIDNKSQNCVENETDTFLPLKLNLKRKRNLEIEADQRNQTRKIVRNETDITVKNGDDKTVGNETDETNKTASNETVQIVNDHDRNFSK